MADASLGDAHPLAELIAGVRRRLAPEPGRSSAPGAVTADTGVDDQWRELAAAVDEIVEVVLVQQDLMENLLLRMSRLEGREVAPRPRRGA